MGELVSRGSKYSDADRRMAVLEYSLCDSLASVSKSTGISRRTLSDWLKSEWWNQLTVELHQQDSEPVSTGSEVGEVAETKIGRPTAYKPEYAEQAMRLCLLGATDGEMADFFHVSEQTINSWKGKHPKFLESLTAGKMEADANVATSLYKRATGSSHPETRVTQVQGKIVETTITKHYPPDTQAMGLWLKNRRSNQWRETNHIKLVDETPKLVVIMSPEHLAKHELARNPPIDGECEQIDP